MSAKTTSEDFSVLKNGIDSQLEIICHNESNFYNVTKTAKMIANILKKKENEESGEVCKYPYASSKLEKPSKWFDNDSTSELIDECKKQTKLDIVYYELKKGTPVQFAGTYVHKLLYDHFLAWLDPRYAIKISIILDNIHQEANRKIIEEKDSAIARLEAAIEKQGRESKARDEAQSAEIQKLLSYAKNTTSELSEARLDIQDNTNQIERLTDKVEECREVIIDRMDEHTINPESITKRQYFVCLQHPEYNNILYVIRSQKSNIKKQLKAHKDWDVLIEPTEDPNSIKCFNRFKDRVKQIEKAWKSELKDQYKQKEISRDEYNSKIVFMYTDPLITINRNDVEFDDSRISLEEIIRMMNDITFSRFKLSVP